MANSVFLERKLSKMALEENGDVLEHIKEMDMKIARLEASGQIFTENRKSMILMQSLPKSYDPLIMSLDVLNSKVLTFKFVSNKIINEFNRRKNLYQSTSKSGVKKEEVAFSASAANKKYYRKKPDKRNSRCFICKKLGHWKAECKFKGKNNGINNLAIVDNNNAFSSVENNDNATHPIYLDSCASKHITGYKKLLKIFVSVPVFRVQLSDNKFMDVKGKGTMIIDCYVNKKHQKQEIKDVYFIEGLGKTLLSLWIIVNKGFKVDFDKHGCNITKNGILLAQAKLFNGIYKIITKSTILYFSPRYQQKQTMEVWHHRLAHLGKNGMHNLKKHDMVLGFDYSEKKTQNNNTLCKGCIYGKISRLPFDTKYNIRSGNVLDLIHTDMWGPAKTSTIGGNRYFVTFIDNSSNYGWIYCFNSRTELLNIYLKFESMVQTLFNKKIKDLRSDNGGEYISNNFEKHLEEQGTFHQKTVPHTPQQNGIAERRNKSILEAARSMIHAANLPKKFWGER